MDPNILRLRTAIAHQRTCEAAPVIAWSIGRPLSESEMKILSIRADKMRSPIHVREATCLKQHELIADLLAAAADALAIAKPQSDEAAIAHKIDEAEPEIGGDTAIAPKEDPELIAPTIEAPGDLLPGETQIATIEQPEFDADQEREIDLAIANATAMTRRKRR